MNEAAFEKLVLLVAGNEEFVRNYGRLRGTSLSKMATRSPLDTMIDEATGRQDAELAQFAADVKDLF